MTLSSLTFDSKQNTESKYHPIDTGKEKKRYTPLSSAKSQDLAHSWPFSSLIREGVYAKTLQAGIYFLQSGGFEIVPEDYLKKKGKSGFTICQDQGTPELRKTARILARMFPDFLSPAVLRKIKKFHEKNFRFLQLKRLGHVLSLDGFIKLADGTITRYNGFNEAFTLPMISSSIRQYAAEKDSLIVTETASWIASILNRSASNDIHYCGQGKAFLDLIQNQNFRNLLSISGGYDWHSTMLFFFRGHLIYCNRGAGSGNYPGVAVFYIPDLNKLTAKLIDKLIQRQNVSYPAWKLQLNLATLIEKLDLQLVYWHEQRLQKTGNCTYPSAKSGARALLSVRYIMDNIEDNLDPIPGEVWKEAFDKTELPYKEWNMFDKNLVISDALKDASPNADLGFISKEQYKLILEMIFGKILENPIKYTQVSSQVLKAIRLLS